MRTPVTWRQVPGWFDFDDVYQEAVDRAPSGAHFVEVGVLLGKSALFMAEAILRSGKEISFDAVDTLDCQVPALAAMANNYRLMCAATSSPRPDEQLVHRLRPSRREVDASRSPGLGEHLVRKYRSLCAGADCSRTDEVLEIVASSRDHQEAVERLLDLSGLGELVKIVRARGQERASIYFDGSLDLVYVDARHTREDTAEILRAFVPKVRPGGILAGHDHDAEHDGVREAVRDVLGERVEVRRHSFLWTRPLA